MCIRVEQKTSKLFIFLNEVALRVKSCILTMKLLTPTATSFKNVNSFEEVIFFFRDFVLYFYLLQEPSNLQDFGYFFPFCK